MQVHCFVCLVLCGVVYIIIIGVPMTITITDINAEVTVITITKKKQQQQQQQPNYVPPSANVVQISAKQLVCVLFNWSVVVVRRDSNS